MGRARALRDAYTDLVSQSQDGEALPLTTVDVFHWLEDEDLFIRTDTPNSAPSRQQPLKSSRSSRKAQQSEDPRAADFCRACGLQRAHHPRPADADNGVKPFLTASTPSLGSMLPGTLCVSFHDADDETTRPPVVDVDELLAHGTDSVTSVPYGLHPTINAPRLLPSNVEISPETFSAHPSDLVAVADPRLVAAIRRMTGSTIVHIHGARTRAVQTHAHADRPHGDRDREPEVNASTLSPRSLTTAPALGGLLAEPRTTVERQLAPSATLALAVRTVVRQLVLRGVEAFRQDEAALRVASGRHRHERARQGGGAQRVLTPAHVLGGLARHARSDVASSALLLSIAKLGVSARRTSSSDIAGPCADDLEGARSRGSQIIGHLDAGQNRERAAKMDHGSGDGARGENDCAGAEAGFRLVEHPDARVKMED